MAYTCHFESPLGPLTAASDGENLTGLWFDGQKYFAAGLDPEYFRGEVPDFVPPLRLKGTAFQRAVWEILLTIPYGETMTYGEIARKLAKEQGLARMSAQAVGGAVGHNPVSLIVPCHRVVGADGSLTGYAGGVERKKQLLMMEKRGAKEVEAGNCSL